MPKERIQERTVEQTIDDSVPRVKEEIIEVVKIPQERIIDETDVFDHTWKLVVLQIEQGRVRGRGDGDKKIYVECRDDGEVEEIGDQWKWLSVRGLWWEGRDVAGGRPVERWRRWRR